MKAFLEFYEELRYNLRVSDIVGSTVNLTKKGKEYSGLCPFHSERTASFTVNDEKRFYHCFGCSAHGDVVKFVAETQGISYKEAAIRLANEYGIEVPKISKEAEKKQEEAEYLYEILHMANDFFQEQLDENVLDYLKMRGLTTESINNFSIGYAPGGHSLEKFMEKKSISREYLVKAGLYGHRDNNDIYPIFNKRIMFPIKNIYNKIIGFGGRAIGNIMPKYINSPETLIFKKSDSLYGENIATSQSYKDNYSIIVEGYMDVIALHQAGFKQGVASLGTAVTEKHLKKLWRVADEIIACLDGDEAGSRASERLIKLALPAISAKKSISFLELPAGNDPDDLVKNHGSKVFQLLLNKRRSLSETIWQKEYGRGKFVTAEAKTIFEHKLQTYLELIADHALKNNFQRYFKEMSWQYIISKKTNWRQKAPIISNIVTIREYSEIDYLEKTICAFLLKYPNLIIDCAENLHLQDEKLNDFKNWLEDLQSKEPELTSELVIEKIKISRFNPIFELLSESDNLSLDYNFLNNENISKTQILIWLCKKHYLLMLKNEYINISDKFIHLEGQERALSYIKEIQEVIQDLDKLSGKFLTDN